MIEEFIAYRVKCDGCGAYVMDGCDPDVYPFCQYSTLEDAQSAPMSAEEDEYWLNTDDGRIYCNDCTDFCPNEDCFESIPPDTTHCPHCGWETGDVRRQPTQGTL